MDKAEISGPAARPMWEKKSRRCVAGGCFNSSFHGVALHGFPIKNAQLCRQWVNFVKTRRKNWIFSGRKSTYLCSSHFSDDCYPIKYRLMKSFDLAPYKKALLPNSVPSIHTPADTSPMSATHGLLLKSRRCPKTRVGGAFRKRERTRVVAETITNCEARELSAATGSHPPASHPPASHPSASHPSARHPSASHPPASHPSASHTVGDMRQPHTQPVGYPMRKATRRLQHTQTKSVTTDLVSQVAPSVKSLALECLVPPTLSREPAHTLAVASRDIRSLSSEPGRDYAAISSKSQALMSDDDEAEVWTMSTQLSVMGDSRNVRSVSPAFVQNEQCDVAKIVSVRSLNCNYLHKAKPQNSQSEKSADQNLATKSSDSVKELQRNVKPINMSYQLKATIFSERLLPKYIPSSEAKARFGSVHSCQACGDQFCFESSLETHKVRLSMNIDYYCSQCKERFLFHNKCALLIHLKMHQQGNVKQMPINVRNISISSLTDEQFKELPNVMVNVSRRPSDVTNSRISCFVCGLMFASFDNLATHLGKDDQICSFAYNCKTCYIYTPRKCSLALHNRLHEACKVHPLICPECGRLFNNAAARDKHIRFSCLHYCRIPTFKCPCCKGVVFERDYYLALHITNNHMVTYYKCHSCPLAFKTCETYKTHAETTHSPVTLTKIYRCPLCETVFNNSSLIRDHINMHVETIKKNTHFAFKCIICKKFSDNRKSLLNHMDRVHNTKPNDHFCLKCNIGFHSEIQLNQHMCSDTVYLSKKPLSHSFPISQNLPITQTVSVGSSKSVSQELVVKNTHVNPKCNSAIKIIPLNHIQSLNYPNAKISFITSSCAPKQLATDKYIPIAPKTALVDKSPVPKSGVSSVSNVIAKSTVPLNINADAKERKAKKKKIKDKLKKKRKRFNNTTCAVCKADFVDMDKLMEHLVVHQENGLYTCTNCLDKTFSSLDEVAKHESICELYKPGSSKQAQYKCPDCWLAFVKLDEMEEHRNSEHNVARQYPCHLCGFTYDHEQKLQDHIGESHNSKLIHYACDVCKNRKRVRFTSKGLLQRHLINKHRMDQTQLDAYFSPAYNSDVVVHNETSPGTVSPKRANPDAGINTSPIKRLKLAGDKNYTCAKCSFSSESHDLFKAHIVQHKSDPSLQCVECGLCFVVFPSLRKHLIIVHQSRDVSQYEVPRDESDDDVDLVRPISTYIHTPPNKRLSSPITDAESTSSQKSVVNDLECTVCYRVLEDQTTLMKHMRNHGMAFIRSKRRSKPFTRPATDEEPKNESIAR